MKSRLVGHEEVAKLSKIELSNVLRNLEDMKEYMEVFDEMMLRIANVFAFLQRALLEKPDPLLYVNITNLYLLMMQDCLSGMVNFSKGYVSDSSFHARRVLESAAIAVELRKTPEKVKVYSSMQSEKERKKYVDTFPVYKLIKTNLSALAVKHYERLCLSVHPSAFVVGDRAAIDEKLGHSLAAFEYQDTEDLPKRLMFFMMYTQTVFTGFKDLLDSFKGDESFNTEESNGQIIEFIKIWQTNQRRMTSEFPELLITKTNETDKLS